MTDNERQAKIEAYGAAYETLTNGLKAFPTEMWVYKPSPEEWSIHELIIHITDSEANSFVRARRFIAEPGASLMGYDENQWGIALNYAGQSTEAAIELFRWLRLNTYNLIKAQPATVWANMAIHSESGPMNMATWLDIYERHVPEHLAQMAGVYAAWQAQQK